MRLIPRKVFFGNPDRICVRLSPDGNWLGYIAPHAGVLNIHACPVSNLDDVRVLTREKKRGIRSFSWLYTNEHLCYARDDNGDENWQVRLLNVTTGEDRGLTPEKGVNAHVEALSRQHPTHLVVSHNARTGELFDPHMYDLSDHRTVPLFENPGYASLVFNHDLEVVYGARMLENGDMVYDRLDKQGHKAIDQAQAQQVPYDDVIGTSPVFFSLDNTRVTWLDSRGRDFISVVEYDLAAGAKAVKATPKRADVDGLMINPITYELEGFCETYGRREWHILADECRDDMQFLAERLTGEIEITSRTVTNDQWIVVTHGDQVPVEYHLYDRRDHSLHYLFCSHAELKKHDLNPMQDVYIQSRDGLELVSYLTLPKAANPDENGRPTRPVPLVLDVHGGPQARDRWGYDSLHQWLSNRGYAVLNVNFRSSTGFGKAFRNAGDGEWSRKMHDDLLDAVAWAIDQGITRKDQVCISGGSYGGYAALVGLTFTPEVFKCAVDIVGPSNLITLLESIPPYWKPVVGMLEKRLGGHLRDEAGRQALLDRSPITRVSEIKRPLLIGQGANDPRVKKAESDQIAQAMQEKGLPVTYVLFPDEGHGFARPENRMAFYAITEAFLAQHLGGALEPVGDDFDGATHKFVASGPEVKALL